MIDMMMRRFGKRLALVTAIAATCAAPAAWAQQAEPAPKPGKLINAGDVLSGELNAMKIRGSMAGRPAPPSTARTFS